MSVLEKNSDDFSYEINALDLPVSIPKKKEAKLDVELINFLHRIQKNQSLGKNHVNAFLATVPHHDQKHRENYLLIQARLLLVAHELNDKTGYGGFIIRAFREYRILVDEEKWDWLDKLPDFSRHISDLVDELGQAREKLPSKAKQRTLAFESLLKRYKKNKAVYTPRKVDKKIKYETISDKPFEIVDSRITFDEDETSYCELLPKVSVTNQKGMNSDEHVADQFTTKRLFKFKLVAPDDVKKSLELQLTASKAAANHIQRREKMLITDFSFLTQYEVTILVDPCFINLKSDSHYCILLIMLWTGKTIEEAITGMKKAGLPKKAPFNEHAVFLFRPELPAHPVNSDIEQLLNRSTGSVIQALPIEIRHSIERYRNKLQNAESIVEGVKKTIKELNLSNSINLTPGRITNYLMCYLNNKGMDSTEITLILGKGLRQESGSYYYQINASKLLSVHQNYLRDLIHLTSHKIKIIQKSSTRTIGSQLIIKPEQVASLFKLISKQLDNIRLGGWKEIEQFHNLYVIYCIELLNLSTGHRPVNNPFEDITKIDLIAKTIFISDKEERNELAARVIALPEIAVEQIQLYQQHLKKLESEISCISSHSGNAIHKAITGSAPLFFFLNELKIEPVIPSRLTVKLENIWPFPLNWHRHFMRTWLRNNEFSGQWVNGWMGHLSMGSAGYSRYSGLAMADLKEMSKSIQELLCSQMGIKTVKPWK